MKSINKNNKLENIKNLTYIIKAKQEHIRKLNKFIKQNIILIENGCILRPHNKDTVLDMVKQIKEIKLSLINSTNELISIQNDAISKIDSIDNYIYRTILYLHYVDNLTLDKIAEKTCYSRRHISRLHSDALHCYNQNVS